MSKLRTNLTRLTYSIPSVNVCTLIQKDENNQKLLHFYENLTMHKHPNT